MYKRIIFVLIYLCITLPAISLAEALKKYSVPQQILAPTIQQKAKPSSGQVSDDVYLRFKRKIKNYSQDEKDKLVEHFRSKIEKARTNQNKSAVAYYQRLIGILHSSQQPTQ